MNLEGELGGASKTWMIQGVMLSKYVASMYEVLKELMKL